MRRASRPKKAESHRTKPAQPKEPLLRAMREAGNLSVAELAERATIRSPRDPRYVQSEVLAHRIRALRREGNLSDFNRLARPFTERVLRLIRAKAAGIDDSDSEDFSQRVYEALFRELLSSPAKYTFYEIAFNRTLRFRRIDAYRDWQAEKLKQELETAFDKREGESDADFLDRTDDPLTQLQQRELDPLNAILKDEESSRAIEKMEEAGLTEAEKAALILAEALELKISSRDMKKETVAKHLGVTGRTVQNLISRAKEKLRGKE